eukprot:sb/3466638/
MGVVTKLFHFLAGIYHVYFLLYPTINQLKSTPAASSFGGKWKYLTFITNMINCWYFITVFCQDFIFSFILSEERNKKVKRTLDALFGGIVCPAAIVVGTAFWGIYHTKKAAIWSDKLDEFIPPMYNHMMHTFLIPIALMELVLYQHDYPSVKGGLMLCTSYTVGYIIWLHVVKHVGGVWAYPIFDMLNSRGQAIFLGIMVIAMYMIFFLQHFLHQLVHGQLIVTNAASKRVKSRKVDMGDVNEKHIRSVLNQQLIATGEKEKLLDLLKVKLIECGWRNEMKQHCREALRRNKSKANVEELIEELTPKARARDKELELGNEVTPLSRAMQK